MRGKDGMEPFIVFSDEFLGTAGSPEEFEQRIREGKPFKLEEKAGIHIISLDKSKPPIVEVKGDFELITSMLAFAISEIIEDAVKHTGDRDGVERHFRFVMERAIMASRM